MEKKKGIELIVKMSDLDLTKVRDVSLSLFKDNAPDPGKAEHFLTECWVEAVIGELNRNNFTNLSIKRDHEHLTSDKE